MVVDDLILMVLIHLKRLPSTVSVGWCVSVDEWVPLFVLSTPEASHFCYIVGGRVLGVVDTVFMLCMKELLMGIRFAFDLVCVGMSSGEKDLIGRHWKRMGLEI